MRIVELKSQSIKIIYKPAVEQIKIGDFVSFTDGDVTVIAQVYKILTSDAADDFNQADLLFVLTRQYDLVKQWQGEYISANAVISIPSKEDIEKYLYNQKSKEKFAFTKSAQFKDILTFDFAKFNTPAFIGYEKKEDNFNLVNSISQIFNKLNKTFIIVDVKGNTNLDNVTKIVAGNNVKLPLNSRILENLCNTDLQGISLESKAVIEDVLMELSEYVKTSETGFIPISQLISVVNDFYKKSKIQPLILLLNKLKHYKNMNIFADLKEEVEFLYDSINENKPIIFDLSEVEEEWQKIFFANLIEQNEKIKKDFYINISFEDNIYDKKIINYLLFKAGNNGIKPIISINYRNSLFDAIFDFSNNAFLFKTNNALKKRSVLTDVLQSLPQNTFIVKGKLSNGLLLPLIINEQEEEILDIIENEITAENNVEEIKEDVEEQNIAQMDNALRETPNPMFKTPPEFINTPVNLIAQPDNIEITPKQGTEEYKVTNTEIIKPDIEVKQEEITKEPEENILEFENLTIPDVVEKNIVENQDAPEDNINVPEIIEENVNQEEEQIINNNILQDEDIEIPSVEEAIPIAEISEDDDILDLVENEEEPELENVDIDELDFLNESVPDIMQSNNNEDDELLDLIDDNVSIKPENSLDDIEFEPIEQEKQSNQLQEEEIPIQNTNSIPVYPANNYADKTPHKELKLKEGDIIKHSKYGVGTVKKITSHADKVLCHVNFDGCGRRLLDPDIADVEIIG